eukprot:3937196-Rhodomonas_salina.1
MRAPAEARAPASERERERERASTHNLVRSRPSVAVLQASVAEKGWRCAARFGGGYCMGRDRNKEPGGKAWRP